MLSYKFQTSYVITDRTKDTPHDDNTAPYDETPVEEQPQEDIDWKAEYTDENGKLKKIANPELIEKLRPHLDCKYPERIVALNIIEEFYGNRFPSMELFEWGKLIDEINWANPYPQRRSSGVSTPQSESYGSRKVKTHILRVEYEDGTVIQHNNVSLTYAQVIKDLDPELVSMMEIKHAGVNIASRELDEKYGKYQKDIGDGWYVMTNSSTEDKKHDLEAIAEFFDLNIKIDYVSLDSDEVDTDENVPEDIDSSRKKIKVTFPDGRIIQPHKMLEALVEVVKYAGPERVRDLNIICCADNLILKNPKPRYEKPCKPVGDGWLCNTCSDTGTKYQQIMDISNRLNLGLKAEIV